MKFRIRHTTIVDIERDEHEEDTPTRSKVIGTLEVYDEIHRRALTSALKTLTNETGQSHELISARSKLEDSTTH